MLLRRQPPAMCGELADAHECAKAGRFPQPLNSRSDQAPVGSLAARRCRVRSPSSWALRSSAMR